MNLKELRDANANWQDLKTNTQRMKQRERERRQGT
jgi:hypothetical protein